MSFAAHDVSYHSTRDPSTIQRTLLTWFAANKRDLPWRGSDAYGILCAEVMAQQTRAAVAAAKWQGWMLRWPTVTALAAATVDDVRSEWAGLGYYRRAVNLHKAAQVIVGEHGGVVPNDVEALLRLPGVGPYTAGAVASTVYGRRVPAVDGNVIRVLSRLCAVRVDPLKSGKYMQAKAFELLPAEDGEACGALNEALMEFGATLCTPKAPQCDVCPIKHLCRAYDESQGRIDVIDIEDACLMCAESDKTPVEVTDFPLKKSKTPPRDETTLVVIVQRPDNTVALVQRPTDGLLGGMMELPQKTITNDDTDPSTLLHAFLGDHLDMDQTNVTGVKRVGELVHLFTHIRQKMEIWTATWTGGGEPPVTWATLASLKERAVTAGNHKAIALWTKKDEAPKTKRRKISKLKT